MKKFRFELQDILDIKEFEEEAAKAELAKALSVETEIQNKLDKIALDYTSVKQNMSGMTAMEYMNASRFFQVLDFQKEGLLNELTEAKMVSDQKRQILNEIMKKTQALKNLKESQLKTYNQELQIIEEDEADEINTIRFSQKK